MDNPLTALSDELAQAVEQAGRTAVVVHGRPRQPSSGVYWREGVIVTVAHGVKRDEELSVTLPDGETATAALAGRDTGTDLAVLKVEGAHAPTPEFASEGSLKVGNVVLSVGRSRDTGVHATMGIISALSGAWRTWRGGLIDPFIRLDVSFYPGSSGGAVVDTQGRVLGIATSGLTRLAGLAIPNATVNRVTKELLSKGHISRGYLGTGLQPVPLPANLRDSLGIDQTSGLIVLSVEPKGPAAGAGVLLGDILVALDRRPVQDTDDVQGLLGAEAVGKTLKASIVRGGALTELDVTAGERPRRGE